MKGTLTKLSDTRWTYKLKKTLWTIVQVRDGVWDCTNGAESFRYEPLLGTFDQMLDDIDSGAPLGAAKMGAAIVSGLNSLAAAVQAAAYPSTVAPAGPSPPPNALSPFDRVFALMRTEPGIGSMNTYPNMPSVDAPLCDLIFQSVVLNGPFGTLTRVFAAIDPPSGLGSAFTIRWQRVDWPTYWKPDGTLIP